MRESIWSIQGIAHASARKPKSTIGLWVLAVIVAGWLASSLLGSALTTEMNYTNEPESVRADRLLEERLRGERRAIELVVIRAQDATIEDAAFRRLATGMEADVAALPDDVVEQVASVFSTNDPSLVSEDRDTALIRVVMAGSLDEAQDNIEQLHDVTIDREIAGFDLYAAGDATMNQDFTELSERDLQKGEAFGMPIALIVLLVVFGAVVAAFVPIVLAIMAIAVAIGITALMGVWFDFSFFVVNMITMMGLAVGIDYSLFIVSRYREERAHGRDKMDAIGVASGTAGRAVFFSGMTVVLALLGMMLIPTTIFRSLATGAILVVLASVTASMTLLPAVLSMLGDRIDKGHIPFLQRTRRPAADGGGFWDRAARRVMRHPVISVVLAGGLLIAAALPVFGMETGFSGVSTMPDGVQSKRAFEVLSQEFAGGQAQPVEIVVDGDITDPSVGAAIDDLQRRLGADGVFGETFVQANDGNDLALISLPLQADPSGDQATDAVKRLRDEHIPAAFDGVTADVPVGGWTAFGVDFFDLTDTYTPIVFVFVLGLSFVLLTLVFRSLVVPAKAIVMNLLSVGAAYGLIVLVNQKGYLADFFGFQQVDVIEAWLPLFLFSVLFGLSMDYHVFLLSRIRERYEQTGDNTEAVVFGVRSTAGIITGAALIMVAVFSGFAAGEMASMQQTGFGLAVAVLIDATIVRTVLVPASMRLLGRANWYLPSWLEWLPKLRVEGEVPAGDTITLDRPAVVDLTTPQTNGEQHRRRVRG